MELLITPIAVVVHFAMWLFAICVAFPEPFLIAFIFFCLFQIITT